MRNYDVINRVIVVEICSITCTSLLPKCEYTTSLLRVLHNIAARWLKSKFRSFWVNMIYIKNTSIISTCYNSLIFLYTRSQVKQTISNSSTIIMQSVKHLCANKVMREWIINKNTNTILNQSVRYTFTARCWVASPCSQAIFVFT